jgi:hypothetical protein
MRRALGRGMDQQRQRQINDAVEELTRIVQDSYRMALENTAALQESNTRLARSLYESNVKVLEAQAEIQADIHHYTLQDFAEQIRKQQESFQKLSQESLSAYEGFLDSLSSYHEGMSQEPANYPSHQVTAPSGRGMEAVQLLDEWLNDESGYDQETWPDLKAALERDRLSNRKLFVD